MSGVGPIGRGGYAALIQQAAARRAQGVSSTSTSQVRGLRPSDRLSVADPKNFTLNARSVGAPVAPASNAIDKVLSSVHDAQSTADQMVIDLASGNDVNIHNTMVELEKADIALKYTVQLRNRALSAYEELMRLQV